MDIFQQSGTGSEFRIKLAEIKVIKTHNRFIVPVESDGKVHWYVKYEILIHQTTVKTKHITQETIEKYR